jgi:hypothetical protein
MESLRRFESRQQTFIASSRWTPQRDGTLQIRQKGVDLTIEPVEQHFQLRVNGLLGRKQFQSVPDAKRFAFTKLEDGTIDAFLRKRNLNR